MNCPNCQVSNPIEAKFCMNCGYSLMLSCPNCSHQNFPHAKFCIECGYTLNNEVVLPAENKEETIQRFIPKEFAEKLEIARSSQSMKGERRIVSILFCDVKGSTSMAENLDPEIWAEIMNRAFEYLITPIYRYEGTLARLMGDSILAFFGAPIAHEDDARRAILAGLDIVRSIQPFKEEIRRKYNLDFDVRVGINTGLVVVGGVGSDLFMEYTALGDAINIASRIEQTAQPGTIQVGEDTHKQAARFFEFEQLDGVEVKGKNEPVKVYRVVGVSEQPSAERGLRENETPLIGRSAELDTLKHAIDAVDRGRGQIVCLISESGLGKSRLLKEARRFWENNRPGEQPFGMLATRWNQAASLSYESSRPYGLVQRLIRNYIGISQNDQSDVVRQRLTETVAILGKEVSPEWLDLFEIMLGIKDGSNSQEISGEDLKRKIYAEMLVIMELLAQQGPAVIAVDDLHWSDSASTEFLIHLFQLADRLPILFLCSLRPHHNSPAWMLKQAAEMNYSHRYTQINLSPLSGEESNQMIDHLLGGADLPQDIRDMIFMKAEGNPFFMEEVVQGLIDEENIIRDKSNGHWKVNAAVKSISIPDNLHSVITARIDRLEDKAKRVLQMASVVGRTFYSRVLEIINDATDELDNELLKMQRMGLILEVAHEPELEYIFRQAITHETAYNTILLKHRREYHRRVGEAFLQLFSDRVEEFSSLLAHHFYHAQDPRALQYFKMEGDAAFRLYANVEAIDAYTKAIEVARWTGVSDLQILTDLYLCLGRAFELNSEFKQALDIYKELENLAIDLEDQQVELTALFAQAQIYSVPSSEFNLDLGIAIVEKAQKLAEEMDNKEALAKIYWISMNLYRFNQSLADAQKDGEKAIALARELNLQEQLAYSLNDTAHAYSMNGRMDRAREVSLEASELWQKMNNLPMLADSLSGLAAISVYSGDFEQAYQYSDRAYEISRKIENVWGQSYSRHAIGLADLERGEIDLALEHLQQSIRDAETSRFKAGELLGRTFLSVLYAELGSYELAVKVVEHDYKLEIDNLAVGRAFFLGASLLAHARAGHLGEAEKIIDKFRAGIEDGYFIARHYFVLGLCYFYLAKEDYVTVLRISEDFFKTLGATGIVFLNAELLLIMGVAFLHSGRRQEAKAKLREALQVAQDLGSRKTLWQIYYYLGVCAQQDGEGVEAQKYFDSSREILSQIMEHLQDPELRESFMSRKEAQDLIGLMAKIE